MSREICSSAIEGAAAWVAQADAALVRAMESKSAAAKVGFPNTAYYLPVISRSYAVALLLEKLLQADERP